MTEPSKELTTSQAPKAALKAGGAVGAIIPRDIDELGRIVGMLVSADMIPRGMKGRTNDETFSKACAAIMAGAEVGFPPMKAITSVMVVNGMPCLWGDGPMALVQQSGTLEYYRKEYTGEDAGRSCTVTAKRKGQENEYTQTFSIEMAKGAGLLNKGPWRQYPDRMLHARARAFVLRDGWADVLMGLSIREEVEDYAGADKPEVVDTSALDDAPAPENAQDAPEQLEAEEGDAVDPVTGAVASDDEQCAELLGALMNCSTGDEIDSLAKQWGKDVNGWPDTLQAKVKGAFDAARNDMDGEGE